MFFDFTLRKIFEIAEVSFPKEFNDILDLKIKEISTNSNWINSKEDGIRVLVAYNFENTTIDQYIKMANEGVVIITYKPIYDETKDTMKIILLSPEDMRKLWLSLGAYISNYFAVPTIAVTGSLGKTTVTYMLEKIFEEKFKVFSTAGNLNNSEFIVREMVRYFDDTYTMHLQEIGGGAINSVKRVGEMLAPDVFVITTILPHHMNRYKSIENVIKDKISLDASAKDNAFGVINIDNDALREHKYIHKIVTCGIEHKEADYVATNIRQDEELLKLDIINKKDGSTTSIDINIPGKHNAYNVLLAFATAKEYGIDEDVIVNGFKKYKSDLIRQNLTNISGRLFYIDCFNHSVDSMKAALSFLQEFETSDENKKIAILGGENALGDMSYEYNFQFGLSLEKYDSIDEFIFYGLPKGASKKEIDLIGDAHSVYEGAKRVLRHKKISYYSDLEELASKLLYETQKGDVILLKGIVHRPLWPAVDIAFGAGLTMRSGTMIVTHRVNDEYSAGIHYKHINGINLSKAPINDGVLKIPNVIEGKPVFRVGREAFRNNMDIKKIEFGKALVNIGVMAFKGCTNIKELYFPCNVLHIEDEAFFANSNLEYICMKGVEHISCNAFANCKSLKYVEVPSTCLYIAEDAFSGCDNVCFIIKENCYVEDYARRHAISILKYDE